METEKTISKKSRTKKDKEFVTVGEAAALTGLHPHTIRKFVEQSSFICYKTPSGQRRINSKSLEEFIDRSLLSKDVSNVERKNFLYARVSSENELDELNRQIEFINRPEFSEYTLIKDIASGIDFKRKGLSIILDECLTGTIGNVVVAYKDILFTYGFELIDEIVKKAGGKITILDKERDEKSILSIMQMLCGRKIKKKIGI